MTLLGLAPESVRIEPMLLVIVLCCLHDALEVSEEDMLLLSEITVQRYL